MMYPLSFASNLRGTYRMSFSMRTCEGKHCDKNTHSTVSLSPALSNGSIVLPFVAHAVHGMYRRYPRQYFQCACSTDRHDHSQSCLGRSGEFVHFDRERDECHAGNARWIRRQHVYHAAKWRNAIRQSDRNDDLHCNRDRAWRKYPGGHNHNSDTQSNTDCHDHRQSRFDHIRKFVHFDRERDELHTGDAHRNRWQHLCLAADRRNAGS